MPLGQAKAASAVALKSNALITKEVLLPLVPIPPDESKVNETVTFSLPSNPTDTDSPKYKLTCHILQGDEDLRTLITWHQSVHRVLKGFNLSNKYQPAVNIIETMLRGTPQSFFQQALEFEAKAQMDKRIEDASNAAAKKAIRDAGWDAQDNKLYDQVERAIRKVISELVPRKVLARVKRYLRRNCRKPADMKVRVYFQHLCTRRSSIFLRIVPIKDSSRMSY